MEVTDPLTVTIRLKSAYAPFLQVLSNRAGMMVSPTAVAETGEDFATMAVGAGPYRVASWTKNAELVLEAFDGYWRGAPAIPRVVFKPIADETVRLTNLRSGTIQLIDGVPPQAVPQVESDAALDLKQSPGLGFNAFSFNTTAAPFDDARIRQAFSMAVDPAVILQAGYFGAGLSVRRYSALYGLGLRSGSERAARRRRGRQGAAGGSGASPARCRSRSR